MLEHETVARLQNEVAGLRAEKTQLQEKCFSQHVEIERGQKNVHRVGEAVNIHRKLQYYKLIYSLYRVIFKLLCSLVLLSVLVEGGGPNEVDGGPNEVDGVPNEVDGCPNEVDGGPNGFEGGRNEVDEGPDRVDGIVSKSLQPYFTVYYVFRFRNSVIPFYSYLDGT